MTDTPVYEDTTEIRQPWVRPELVELAAMADDIKAAGGLGGDLGTSTS
ncbi:MAG: hypothetical protein AAFX04_14285 [Pseudomonadota bacterium]